ncbi:MAG: tetratricopeptide repeat protein [Kiritimatiellia bacterium]
MKQLFLKVIFFPIDLIYLTIDGTISTWRTLNRLIRKQKVQHCHLLQGESNQDAPYPVRAVLKYQNKWLVKFIAPYIHFRKMDKRVMGFCKTEGDMVRPPVWVPYLTLGLYLFWGVAVIGILTSISSDPKNFGRNFISFFSPAALGNADSDPDFLEQQDSQLNPERAERYFLSGLRFFDQQKFPSAQVDFKIAIQSNPTDPKLHFHLAKAYLAMGQTVQGEASVRKTLEYDENHVEALLILAELMERRENRAEALANAEKALTLAPDNLQAIRLNAGLRAATGDRELTRELMDKLYAMDGDNPNTLAFLGRLELTLFQDVETAKARLERSLEMDENHIPSLIAHISVLVQEQDLARVDATIEKVLSLDPENIQALRLQSEIILSRFGLAAGIRSYNRLLTRFGGDLGLRLRYAELLLRSGNLSEGKSLAQQLTASRVPQYERASNWMLAQMYAQVRMHEEALQHARSTLRITPNEANIHLFMAQQLLAMNRVSEARREAEAAMAINREDLRALNILTQTMVRQDQHGEAVKLLESLIEEFPDQDALKMRKIEILMQSTDWMNALSDTRILQEKYPDNAALNNNLAFLLARSGQELDRAMEIAESLKAEHADNPVIMDTFAYVLAARGAHEDALPVYEEALSKAGENVTIRFHYAKSLIALERNQDAARQLEAVLMMNPDFPEADEARELFKQLTSGES